MLTLDYNLEFVLSLGKKWTNSEKCNGGGNLARNREKENKGNKNLHTLIKAQAMDDPKGQSVV